MSSIEPMPAALPSMWRAVKRGYTAEPWLLLIAFALTIAAAMPDALFALWLMLLANGLLQDNSLYIWIGALGLGISATLTWALRVISDRTQRRFRDRVSIALESHVAQLQANVATIAHHERPEYLDRLTVLRDQVFTLDHMYHSMFATAGWFIRLGITGALLCAVHPALLLLAVAALPTVVSSTTRPGVERRVEEQNAPASRLFKHLFDIATTASPGKEVRLSNIGDRILRDRHEAWRRWYKPIAQARWHTAGISVVAWAIFGAGYVGAVVFTVYVIAAPPGAALLVLAAGSRLAAYISATVGELGFLRGIWMDGAKRLAWLEDYSDAMTKHLEEPIPSMLNHGITFENVTFYYPGAEKPALENVSFHIDSGSVVALVGENGAGKTTLVKLLARMYEPTSGRILIDGGDLSQMDPIAWRERLAGAFQDFFRFELLANQTIGLGDQPRIDSQPAVETAVSRAGAEDVLDQLPSGLNTQLGPTWQNGVEVSFGQWQKLSLARGFMRDEPLLLMLDEPTAALDAETEHALFERYASAAQQRNYSKSGSSNQQIVLLVSHRFSTVRMANQIIVMDGSHIVECGSHEELMESGEQYAELYEIQASSYR